MLRDDTRGRRAWRPTLQTALAVALLGAMATADARSPGKDGTLTVSASNTVVNTYTTLSAPATAGATTLTLASTAGITGGDVLMVYQAQGASIANGNTSGYGGVTNIGNTGRYEFVSVGSVSGNTVTLGVGCDTTPLQFSYASGAQVVRVPQYSTLQVNAGASVVPSQWNGSTGGVVAVIVDGTLTVNGSVNANGRGFRGGAVDNTSTASGTDVTAYLSTDPAVGGEKGESIAGYQASYDAIGGRYGRGAPANGGGGGNSHNSGGGGGANGGSAVGWNGQGRPDTSVTGWVTAWNIDGTLTSATNSPGGGRGGYTYAAGNRDALTVPPGDASWGGNQRRERGGLGGRPLANNPSTTGDTRLFFGGGGGAGDGNNGAAAAGGNGGGIVVVIANALAGTGTVAADGNVGGNTVPGHNDGPGGGGGGGSVVVSAPSLGSITVTASGGAGGNQSITGNESEGPGGGGGGGYIAAPGGAGTAAGGANGLTTSAAVTEFTPNGATRGNTGAVASVPARSSLPLCDVPSVSDLTVTKTNTPASGPSDQPGDTVAPGTNTQYQLIVTNSGPGPAVGATVIDTPGAGLSCPPAASVTCTSTAAGACPAGPITVSSLTSGLVLGTLPATVGSNTVTLTFSCAVP